MYKATTLHKKLIGASRRV